MRLQYEQLHDFERIHHDPFLKATAVALLSLVILFTLFVLYQLENVPNAPQVLSTKGRHISVPLIVAWTKYFKRPLGEVLLPTLAKCEYLCEVVDRKNDEVFNRSAAAYIFHGRDMSLDLPKQTSKHLNILFLLESPFHTGSLMYQVPRNYFNATMGYRLDFRYFYPYGHFQQRSPTDNLADLVPENQITSQVKKSRGSLIFVSNCKTHSKRERTVRELGKYTEITVRGRCKNALSAKNSTKGGLCDTDCTDDALIATHRFYLAFENSNCKDYITEKFFDRISQLLVPVVMKRRIYEAAGIPKNSFIAADDFGSVKDLGNYLNFLRENDTVYMRYFEWTKHFRKPNTFVSDALCRLCEDIYREEKLRINDIKNYYEENQCL